jgi:hypothetical protein
VETRRTGCWTSAIAISQPGSAPSLRKPNKKSFFFLSINELENVEYQEIIVIFCRKKILLQFKVFFGRNTSFIYQQKDQILLYMLVYNISLNTEFLIYKIFKNLQLFDIDLQQK